MSEISKFRIELAVLGLFVAILLSLFWFFPLGSSKPLEAQRFKESKEVLGSSKLFNSYMERIEQSLSDLRNEDISSPVVCVAVEGSSVEPCLTNNIEWILGELEYLVSKGVS